MSEVKRLRIVTLGALTLIGMTAMPLMAQTIRYKTLPNGKKAFYVPVAGFSARSANYGEAGNFVLDPDANQVDGPWLSGAAYYFALTAQMSQYSWMVDCGHPQAPSPCQWDQTQADVWVEYQITPDDDLPADFKAFMTGTWYFHTRCQIPNTGSTDDKNEDSNWLIVNGQPPLAQGTDDKGDINITDHVPTDAEWLTAVNPASPNAPQRRWDRACNDVQLSHWGRTGLRPSWTWVGSIDSQHIQKTMTLILYPGATKETFTYRIYEAEASPWNARIDIMCWTNDPDFWPQDADYENACGGGTCVNQHSVTGFSPTSGSSGGNTTITITGTNLSAVTGARLLKVGGGADIVGSNLRMEGADLKVDLPTQNAAWGDYQIKTQQDCPCATLILATPTFHLDCETPTVFTAIEPSTVSNPGSAQVLRIKGANVTLLTSVKLVYANDRPEITAQSPLTPDGEDLLATFDLSCGQTGGAPAGPYHLYGTRDPASCADPLPKYNALWLRKPPRGSPCVWQPWAAEWSNLNKGADLDPDPVGEAYDPTNWDYSFSQSTVMNTPKDTPPDGGSKAFHLFWDSQPPDTQSQKDGSGGIYQEIAVTPGVPITYSYWWKGAATESSYEDGSWFEMLLLDGPFNLYYADGYQEDDRGQNNPYMIRKVLVPNAGGSFPWTQVTGQTPADQGPYGSRPQTITPATDVVTVVFKAGRSGPGGLEFFLDNAEVSQNGGPNLLANGTFESGSQVIPCEGEWMYRDVCESNFWLRSSLTPVLCPVPFADSDGDGDVDQMDFARFQLCYTGPSKPLVDNSCRCLDLNNDDYIDQVDFNSFEQCASGPGVPSTSCD